MDSSLLLRRWLNLCLCLVFAMVVLGGLTRLTESGLSIVRWKLVSGVLPPLGEAAWQKEFGEYQASPQYREVNRGMRVAEFKRIFWLEYLHRLLGRLIGLCVIAPAVFLVLRRRRGPSEYPSTLTPALSLEGRGSHPHHRFSVGEAVGAHAPDASDSEPNKIPRWLPRHMAVASVLVLAQGVAGWLMVKSGLVDVPWVSPYRLALHLLLAVSLFGWLLVARLKLTQANMNRASFCLRRHAAIALVALLLQITLGAFVAGLRAGLTYNSFPLMDGDFFPRGFWQLSPAWRNLTENIPAVQFLHRWWAFVVAGLVLSLAWRLRKTPELRRIAAGAALLVCLQIALGIATLLWAVPVALGTLHQATAVLLFGWLLAVNYAMWHTKQTALSAYPRPPE